jgi:hypothetical protein
MTRSTPTHYTPRKTEPKDGEDADRIYACAVLKDMLRKMTTVEVSAKFRIPVAYVYSASNRYDLNGGSKCPMWAIEQIVKMSMA